MSVAAAKPKQIETPVVAIPAAKQKSLDDDLARLLDDFIRVGSYDWTKVNKDAVLTVAKNTARSIWQARQALAQGQKADLTSINRSYSQKLSKRLGIEAGSEAKKQFFDEIDSLVCSLKPHEQAVEPERSYEPTPIIGETQAEAVTETTAEDKEIPPAEASSLDNILAPILECFRGGEELNRSSLNELIGFVVNSANSSGEAELTADTFASVVENGKFNLDKFKTTFAALKPTAQAQIKTHFEKTLAPLVDSNPGYLAAQVLSNTELEGFQQALISAYKSLPEGEKKTGYDRLAMNEKVVEAFANAIDEIRSSIPAGITARQKSEITREIVQKHLSTIQGISRDDLLESMQYIKTRLADKSTKDERNKEHAGFMAAMGDKAPYLLFALPFIAGPLSKVFRYIPIIGSTLNHILGQLSQTGGSMLMGLIASKFNFGPKQSAAVPAKEQEAPSRREANQQAATMTA